MGQNLIHLVFGKNTQTCMYICMYLSVLSGQFIYLTHDEDFCESFLFDTWTHFSNMD